MSSPTISILEYLIDEGLAVVMGAIRQELLSSVRDESQFERLEAYLSAFPDHPIETRDYVLAARFQNRCRRHGVQGSNTDFLICAVAAGNDFEVLTTDKDFLHFATCLPLCLYQAGKKP